MVFDSKHDLMIKLKSENKQLRMEVEFYRTLVKTLLITKKRIEVRLNGKKSESGV